MMSGLFGFAISGLLIGYGVCVIDFTWAPQWLQFCILAIVLLLAAYIGVLVGKAANEQIKEVGHL